MEPSVRPTAGEMPPWWHLELITLPLSLSLSLSLFVYLRGGERGELRRRERGQLCGR
jgi:hypothetical protein